MSEGLGETLPLPDWFREGFIQDDVAAALEYACPPSKFLRTKTKPQEGLRIYGVVHPKAEAMGRAVFDIEGIVTKVEELPSTTQLAQSTSLFWEMASDPQFKMPDPKQRFGTIMGVLQTLHGHRVQALGWNKVGDIYAIVFEFDDNLFFPWKIVGMRTLSLTETREILESTTSVEVQQKLGGIASSLMNTKAN